MTALIQQDFYLNSSQYTDLKKGVRENKEGANETALQQFESLFITQMLKEMRSAAVVDEDQHSSYMDFYTDMYDKQLATIMAKQGGIGIAKQLQAQLDIDQSISNKDYSGGKFFPLKPDIAADKGMPINVAETGMSLKSDQKQDLKLPSNLSNRVETLLSQREALPHALVTVETIPAPVNLPEEFHQIQNNVDNSVVELTPLELAPLDKKAASVVSLVDEKIQAHHGWQKPANFIQELMPHAKAVADQLGVKPEVIVAQSALETGWGKHTIRHNDGSVAFSLFGIKADSRWDGDTVQVPTLEFRHGSMQKEMAHFRAYDSVGEAVQDYVNFIKGNNRYQEALTQSQDDAQYVKGLQKAGYATDPAYANKIINILHGETLKQGLASIENQREVA